MAKKTTGETAVATVPQRHGGALAVGGTPGNRGGRPSSEFRALMRGHLEDVLANIVKTLGDRKACEKCGRKTSDADMIRLADFFARYGIGQARGSLDPQTVRAMAESVRRHLDPTDEQMQAVFQDWALTLGQAAS